MNAATIWKFNLFGPNFWKGFPPTLMNGCNRMGYKVMGSTSGWFIFFVSYIYVLLILSYIRYRSSAELFYSLLISNILLLLVALLNLRSHPNFFPMAIFLMSLIVLLFIGVGGRHPLKKWTELRRELQSSLFGRERHKVGNFTDVVYVNKTIYSYLRQRSQLAILAILITGLLFALWFVIQYYASHSNIGR
jgi:hypothetical protein